MLQLIVSLLVPFVLLDCATSSPSFPRLTSGTVAHQTGWEISLLKTATAQAAPKAERYCCLRLQQHRYASN